MGKYNKTPHYLYLDACRKDIMSLIDMQTNTDHPLPGKRFAPAVFPDDGKSLLIYMERQSSFLS